MQNIIESLKKQRKQLLQDTSEDIFSRHTSLLEIAIISLYNRLVNRLSQDSDRFRASGAVVAIGAFGRGLLGPNETVRVLFLETEPFPGNSAWQEEITLPLMEAGWKLDVEQGAVDHLMDRARHDFDLLLHLLGARYISGSRPLAENLDKALGGMIEGQRNALLQRLRAANEARYLRQQRPENWLEPDLQQNPGGLADISGIRAACRIVADVRSLEDAIFKGYLYRQEVDALVRAEKMYARLLALLHNLSDEKTTVLRFEAQEILAEKLGYAPRAGFFPVETFMQQVQQLLHEVTRISEDFWARMEEGLGPEAIALPDTEGPAWLETGVGYRFGRIVVHPTSYPQTAASLVHLFVLAARHHLRLANLTKQWVQHHRNVLDTAAGDPMVSQELQELLCADEENIPLVRSFYNQGLLTALIPELASVHGLVQHDAFHAYPVHEHHLRTLRELKRLCAGEYVQQEPEITQIAHGQESLVWLFLAALLHDIGKSAGSGHALRGGEMIPTIARRLGLNAEESDTVQFLVAQHLLLLDNAAMRDLADEEMLAQCALIVGNPERLELLLLLSFATMAATGPKAVAKWRETPVLQLYERVRLLLEKGEPNRQAITEKIEHLRTLVGHEVADFMDSAELEQHFAQLAPRYLLSMHPSAIARHLRLERQLRATDQRFVWAVNAAGPSLELTLMSWQMPDLLVRTAGILTLHDLNITGAQIFTKTNGVVLLVFHCRVPEGLAQTPDWESIRADMQHSLEGKLALDYRIAAHAARRGYLRSPLRRSPSRVLIDNDSSDVYTILEVYSTDRVGLLYTITRTLLDLHVRIYVAKITTKVDQVADVFYIKNDEGNKVTDPDQKKEIQNALIFWLDGPESATDTG
jgi:[protein-PII] uridylyltransferase